MSLQGEISPKADRLDEREFKSRNRLLSESFLSVESQLNLTY